MQCQLKQNNIRPIVAWDDKKTIFFVYRDKDRKKQIYEVKDFQWYFCMQADVYEDNREVINKLADKSRFFPKRDEVGNIIRRTNDSVIYEKLEMPIKKAEKVGKFVKIYCDNKTRQTSSFLRKLKDENIETKEADLNLTKRYMVDNMVEIEEDLTYLFFDIETNDTNQGIVIGRDQIISWAACDDTGKTFFERLNELDSEKDEIELIKNLVWLFMQYDLIIGWNSKQFDLAYIEDRIQKLDIRTKDGILLNESSHWKNFIHIDLMQRLIKLFGPMMTTVGLTGFSLNEVAKVFIDEEKIDRPERIIDLYNKKPKKLKEYNIQDVKLIYNLNIRLQTIPLMIKECFWTGTFMNRFYIGELLDNYILREANKQDYHLDTRPEWAESQIKESIKIRGGFVMEPKTGMYKNVRALDFKSMYPSIIVGWNIGQESLIEGDISKTAENDFKEWLEGRKIEEVPFEEWFKFLAKENKKLNPKNKYFQTANNQFFRREKPSIIAGLVKRLLQERKAYKQQQLDSKYNSIEYKNSQASQEAVKEMSNSMYGITADKQARYFDPRIAEAITLTGQFMNRTSMAILEKMGYLVIYGDTDSVFTIIDSDKETIKAVKELNEKLSKHLIKTYQFAENIIFIEYEKKFKQFIMLDKKRYVGHLVEIDGKKVDSILSKGTENVRKSTIDYTKVRVDEALRMIVKENKDAKHMRRWVKAIKKNILEAVIFVNKKRQPKDILSKELAITMKLSKPISSYKTKPPHVRLAENLIKQNKILETHEGKHVWGQKIEYLILDGKIEALGTHPQVASNCILLEDLNSNIKYFRDKWDRKYYWNVQVYAPFKRIFKIVWPDEEWDKLDDYYLEKIERNRERENQRESKKKEREEKMKAKKKKAKSKQLKLIK